MARSSLDTTTPDDDIRAIFGGKSPLADKRLLLVGTGGVGVEVLKSLALCGANSIHSIDLDTIEVSNLNRQFLFHQEHVGMAKAQVATERIQKRCPTVQASFEHKRIQSHDVDFFRGFDLVISALDNIEARRFLNSRCIAAQVVLIETGTRGHAGQAYAIQRGVTECFDCIPHETPTTFAVCTIRKTPDKPIHCIVWAKHVFNLLFGVRDDANPLSDLRDALVAAGPQQQVAGGGVHVARAAFQKLFRDDIVEMLGNTTDWGGRAPPTPASLPAAGAAAAGVDRSIDAEQAAESMAWNAEQFLASCAALHAHAGATGVPLAFDKDDALAMRFVACAANLRMEQYAIATLSQFDVKGIAGNIVHAVPTTNAMTASAAVSLALQVCSGALAVADTKIMYITNSRRAVCSDARPPPNPACVVCSQSLVHLRVDLETFTMRQFFMDLLRDRLQFLAPTVDSEAGCWEHIPGEDELPASVLDQPLSALGVRSATEIRVTDLESDDLTVALLVHDDPSLKPRPLEQVANDPSAAPPGPAFVLSASAAETPGSSRSSASSGSASEAIAPAPVTLSEAMGRPKKRRKGDQ